MVKKIINTDQEILTPSNFAKKYLKSETQETGRKYVYKLMKEDKIDWTEIDGVKFVVINERTKGYLKSR